MRDKAQRFVRLIIRAACALSCAVICSVAVEAQSRAVLLDKALTVGAPLWGDDLNYVRDQSIAARLIRDLTNTPLVSITAADYGELFGIKSIRRSEVGSGWLLALDQQLTFVNGQRVEIVDLIESLRRCVSVLKDAADKVSIDAQVGEDGRSYAASVSGIAAYKDLIQLLYGCPIEPVRLRARFGSAWGEGTNLIGIGPFQITSFLPAKSVYMKLAGEWNELPFVRQKITYEEVTLRGFSSLLHGISALRMGSIQQLYWPTAELSNVAAEISSDQTLKITECAGVTLVYRRSTDFGCIIR